MTRVLCQFKLISDLPRPKYKNANVEIDFKKLGGSMFALELEATKALLKGPPLLIHQLIES